MLLFLATSCQEEASMPEFVFEEKPWHPQDEAEARAKVLHFLDKTSYGQNALIGRENFEDTEVNEGKWLLEAGLNYVKNANLQNVEITRLQTYPLTIANTVLNEVLLMQGTEMTLAFDQLLTAISLEEGQSGEEAVMADITIEITNAAETKMSANIAYARAAAPPPNLLTWGQAAGQIFLGVATELNPVGEGCIQWLPETSVYQWTTSNPYPQLRCTQSNNICMRTEFSEFGVNYDEAWISEDIAAAIAIGEEYVDGLNQPIGGAYPAVPWSLKGVVVGYDENNGSPGPMSKEQYLFASTIIAAGYSYCY